MSVLIGSSNKSNTLLSAGSQHTIDNKHKSTLLIQKSEHVCEVEECNEGELKIENCLSEFKTKEQKAAALRNLGIESISQWGKIYGHIEDQKDLQELLKAKIDDNIQAKLNNFQNTFNTKIDKEREGLTATQQINYNLNTSDYLLNEQFKKTIEYLKKTNDLDSLTLNDAINILFHALFPIEYKNWTITCSGNISMSRSFEKGTTITLSGDDKIGDITFSANPGNLQNTANFIFNESIVRQNKLSAFDYKYTVYVKDITNSFTFTDNTTKEKSYNYKLYTDDGFEIPGLVKAVLKLNTFQYYYHFSDVNDLMDQTVFEYSKLTGRSDSTSAGHDLKSSKKYIYVLSPTRITEVQTAAGVTANAATDFKITDGWTQEEVTYIPANNGTRQTYWLMRLTGMQSNYIKIKVK